MVLPAPRLKASNRSGHLQSASKLERTEIGRNGRLVSRQRALLSVKRKKTDQVGLHKCRLFNVTYRYIHQKT